MINRYLALFGGLGLLFGVYTIWWQDEAERLETAFPQALAKSLPPGAALRQKVAGVDGFPFRLNVQLVDVTVSWGDDWASTPSLTGIFQPFTGDHLMLHADAPVSFSIEGATGTVNAERALASLVGYEGGAYQFDADTMNVTLEQPAVARLTAARMQVHVRRETVGPPASYALAVSATGVTPKEAATGRLAAVLAKYGEVQKDGTVNIDIDEKDNVFHAAGHTLAPGDAETLKRMF
jgi:hypothetical protein